MLKVVSNFAYEVTPLPPKSLISRLPVPSLDLGTLIASYVLWIGSFPILRLPYPHRTAIIFQYVKSEV